MRKILICFAAGCLGGLAYSLVEWQCGRQGIARWAHVAIAPTLTPAWLYPRIVWGGIWGLLFLLPFLNSRFLLKGSLLSLFPTAVQLLVVFPYKTHKGLAGLSLGMWTPAFILVYNWVWGVVSAATIRISR